MKAYIYQNVDVCSPGSDAYHEGGGLIVVTDGYPNDAVPRGTGNRFEVDGEERFGLPEPTLVYDLPNGTKPTLIVFPDAGCC